MEGSPADKAGIQQGDIITKVGDTPLDGEHSFINTLFHFAPGDTISLEVFRQGEKLKLQVTLGERPRP